MCKSAVCTVRMLISKFRKFFDLRDPSRHFGYNKLIDKSGSTNRGTKPGLTILSNRKNRVFKIFLMQKHKGEA